MTVKTPLRIVDPETGESLQPFDLLENLDALTDDELLRQITRADALLSELTRATTQLRSTVIQRMMGQDAALLETHSFTAKLVPSHSYKYNLDRLADLRLHLTGQQFEEAIKVEYKPNKSALNRLVKLGGPIKTIIEESVQTVEGPPKLEITAKQQPET